MQFVKENIWLKGDLVIVGIVLLLTIVGRLTSNHILVSDILFMSGLALLCLMMFDILLQLTCWPVGSNANAKVKVMRNLPNARSTSSG